MQRGMISAIAIWMAIRSELEAANIKGVDFTTSPNRSYKNGTFASQFIGQAQLIEDKEGNKTCREQRE